MQMQHLRLAILSSRLCVEAFSDGSYSNNENEGSALLGYTRYFCSFRSLWRILPHALLVASVTDQGRTRGANPAQYGTSGATKKALASRCAERDSTPQDRAAEPRQRADFCSPEALVRITPSDLPECFHHRQNDRHRTRYNADDTSTSELAGLGSACQKANHHPPAGQSTTVRSRQESSLGWTPLSSEWVKCVAISLPCSTNTAIMYWRWLCRRSTVISSITFSAVQPGCSLSVSARSSQITGKSSWEALTKRCRKPPSNTSGPIPTRQKWTLSVNVLTGHKESNSLNLMKFYSLRIWRCLTRNWRNIWRCITAKDSTRRSHYRRPWNIFYKRTKIAICGGPIHSKRTGRPGWVDMWDGWFRLQDMVEAGDEDSLSGDLIKRQPRSGIHYAGFF
uniref:Transposase n=1 Tax=Escherichia coli TaxID=562 RepID=A0A891ZW22_ECOLX|nr:transposase [Escherichia coli]